MDIKVISCTTKTLYNENSLIGRLHKYFLAYFETFSVPTAETLFLLVLSILALESAHSIRFLYQHFLAGITEIFCVWQEKAPLNQTGSEWFQYIPLFLYSCRWNIEISYYEQKTFWSLCSYMVRSRKGIEMLINLINISYAAMKLLPYVDDKFAGYRNKSVQDFRFALSEGIRSQVVFATFVEKVENQIKSTSVINALKQAFSQNMSHL